MINKKTLIKSLIIISLLIIIIVSAIQARETLARYETTTNAERDVDVAFWVVDNSFKSERLFINDIYPSTDPFTYTFTVSNFEANDKIAETDMEYDITLLTTTNLPLSYEIERTITIDGVTYAKNEEGKYVDSSGNEYAGTVYDTVTQTLYTDEDGTYYRKINFGTAENPYPLVMDTVIPEVEDGEPTGKNIKTKVTDTYTLKVTFPLEYSAYLDYADLMENIKIELSARQKIS